MGVEVCGKQRARVVRHGVLLRGTTKGSPIMRPATKEQTIAKTAERNATTRTIVGKQPCKKVLWLTAGGEMRCVALADKNGFCLVRRPDQGPSLSRPGQPKLWSRTETTIPALSPQKVADRLVDSLMPGWEQLPIDAIEGVALALERLALYCIKFDSLSRGRVLMRLLTIAPSVSTASTDKARTSEDGPRRVH